MIVEASTPVVVGTDGSDAAQAAVEYASALAARRRLPLRVVHALQGAGHGPGRTTGVRPDRDALLRSSAQRMLDQTLEVLSFAYPALPVQVRLESGEATAVLSEASRGVDTVVVGSRGAGGFATLLLGSTTARLSSRVHCPLIAVPVPDEPDVTRAEVVVGADGSAGSEHALAYGFRVAAETGEPLAAVRVWHDVPQVGTALRVPAVHDRAEIELANATALSQQVQPWAEKHPEVPVELVVLRGHVARTLLLRGRSATLLAVGTRGRGDLHSALLGSVSHALLHHMSGPVAIVPPGT